MARVSRQTRGKRVTELLGEDAEADDEFWGHETWADESEDEVYSTEDGKCFPTSLVHPH
jgi:vacuolar protein sorting-associated protein 72